MAPVWENRFSQRSALAQGSAIRELLKITERPEFISFGGGLPAPEVFPVKEIAAASERVLQQQGAQALQYSTTEGYLPLRRWIAQFLSQDNLQLDENNVLITSGSQQGLDLIGKLMIDTGDRIVVESPTYLAALQSWRTYGAQFVSVPSDQDGIVTTDLPAIFATDPKLVYCVPNFQNPRGVTISEARRRDLIAMACAFDLTVVEDDPYRLLRFEGPALPSLMALDAPTTPEPYNGNVISLGSFSKVLAPGLRVAWIAGPRAVIEKLTLLKQATDLHTATLNQMIAYELVSTGLIEQHTQVIIEEYRRRRDCMLEALAKSFPEGVTWTRPAGGMFLWVTLPEGTDATTLLRAAIEHKVAFVPGTHFFAQGGFVNTMRLNFSNATPAKIREGITRLARVFKQSTRKPAAV